MFGELAMKVPKLKNNVTIKSKITLRRFLRQHGMTKELINAIGEIVLNLDEDLGGAISDDMMSASFSEVPVQLHSSVSHESAQSTN